MDDWQYKIQARGPMGQINYELLGEDFVTKVQDLVKAGDFRKVNDELQRVAGYGSNEKIDFKYVASHPPKYPDKLEAAVNVVNRAMEDMIHERVKSAKEPNLPNMLEKAFISSRDELEKNLLKNNDGIIFSDVHAVNEIREDLASRMDFYKKQGLDIIRIEVLTPSLMDSVHKLYESKGKSKAALETLRRDMCAQSLWSNEITDSYIDLVESACKAGIRPLPIWEDMGLVQIMNDPDFMIQIDDEARMNQPDLQWSQQVAVSQKDGKKQLVLCGRDHFDKGAFNELVGMPTISYDPKVKSGYKSAKGQWDSDYLVGCKDKNGAFKIMESVENGMPLTKEQADKLQSFLGEVVKDACAKEDCSQGRGKQACAGDLMNLKAPQTCSSQAIAHQNLKA